MVRLLTPREQLLRKISDALEDVDATAAAAGEVATVEELAEAALRVIEAPIAGNEDYSRICTCGQNGYPVNHWHSNHPHTEDCPQYEPTR